MPEAAEAVLRRTCWEEVPEADAAAADEELRTVEPLAEEDPAAADEELLTAEEPDADPVVVLRVALPEVVVLRVAEPVVVERVWLPEDEPVVVVLRRTWGVEEAAAVPEALLREAEAEVPEALLRVVAEAEELREAEAADELPERVTCLASVL